MENVKKHGHNKLGFLSGKTRLDMLEELNKSGLMKNKLFINKSVANDYNCSK